MKDADLADMRDTLQLVVIVQYVTGTLATGLGAAWTAIVAGWPAPYLFGAAALFAAGALSLVMPIYRRKRTLKRLTAPEQEKPEPLRVAA